MYRDIREVRIKMVRGNGSYKVFKGSDAYIKIESPVNSVFIFWDWDCERS